MSSPDQELVTVFGGAGFLGRYINQCLKEAGFAVRVAARRDPQDLDVAFLQCDIRKGDEVAAAFDGAVAAINCVSLYVERGENTFEVIHVRAASELARQAADFGLRTLVHVSGINAGPESLSYYAQVRGRGDDAVRAAFPESVVLRPSVIFGPGDNFFNLFAKIATVTPAIPLFGKGDTLLQPVFAGDVAEAAVRAIQRPEAQGEIYELGGPKTYPYRDLIALALERVGRRRWLMPVPFAAWEILARLSSVLPSPPVTSDQVALMRVWNVVSEDAKSFANLGIAPKSVESILPTYL